MKAIMRLIALAILTLGLFALTGCIDPDEALPHYRASAPECPS